MTAPQTLAVVGAGTMGAGIAQVAATSGLDVLLVDLDPAMLDKANARIQDSLQRLIKKGSLSQALAAEATRRIQCTVALSAAAASEVVIEAVFEDAALKERLWRQIDAECGTEAIFGSNTSSLSITRLAAAVRRPERFIGMHFFNPVPVLALVEIIRGNRTDEATCARAIELARRMGKTPVAVKDYPGFVSNRVLMPLINEAAFALYEGVAGAEAIDEIFKLGMAHPLGPLQLADLIGLDVCLNILEVLQQQFGDPKYRPCPLLRQMVAAGKLGRKSGEGFHRYQTS